MGALGAETGAPPREPALGPVPGLVTYSIISVSFLLKIIDLPGGQNIVPWSGKTLFSSVPLINSLGYVLDP